MGKKAQPENAEEQPVGIAGKIYFNTIETRDLKGGKKIYCKVYLDKEKKFKTDVVKKVKGNDEQGFDEAPRLLVLQEDTPVSEAIFQVWNKGSIGSDYIGQVTFPVKELSDGVPRDDWYVLKNQKGTKDKGEIHLQVMFMEPNDDLTKERDEFSVPLQTLLRKGKYEPWKKIMENAPDLDKQDRFGNTPLHVAAELGLEEYVDVLLKRGADLAATNDDGELAIHKAAASESTKCVEMLIAAKADVKKADGKGRTAVHSAATANQPEAIKLLLAAGADIDERNDEDNTALHEALIADAKEAMKVLVESKANLFIKNKEDKTPCELSITLGIDNEELQKEYFAAIDVVDEREFALKKDLKNRTAVTRSKLEHYNGEWKSNPQFQMTGAIGSSTKLLMNYDDPTSRTTQPMEKCSFIIFSTNDDHTQTSYWHDCLHYGSVEPLELAFTESSSKYTIIPYAKEMPIAGDWTLVAYSDADDVSFTELKAWKHQETLTGEWKGDNAGGCIEHDTFKNNPKFIVELPEGQTKFKILLEQARNLADVEPFKIAPYRSFIGFYLFAENADLTLDEPIVKLQKWKNAKEVFETAEVDGSEHKRLQLVVGTYKPAEEATFSVHIFTDTDGVKLTH